MRGLRLAGQRPARTYLPLQMLYSSCVEQFIEQTIPKEEQESDYTIHSLYISAFTDSDPLIGFRMFIDRVSPFYNSFQTSCSSGAGHSTPAF